MTTSDYVLGLSCFYHDAAAVLLKGGEIVAAAQEERFTRRKFDSGFPENAVAFCLKQAGIGLADIAMVAFYEDPLIKLSRLVESQIAFAPKAFGRTVRRVKDWLDRKLPVEELVWERHLPGYKGPVVFSQHHLSHAASAFLPSPFEQATIVVLDGVGEWACTSFGVGKGSTVEILGEQRFPHSIGLLYSAVTQYLGFKVDSGEYKVMGLAPYGEPLYVDLIRDNLVSVRADGSIVLDTAYFDFMVGSRMINMRFESLFGRPARQSEGPLEQFHMDVARSVQVVVEDIVDKVVQHAVAMTGIPDVVMAGGVALNCVSNGKLLAKKRVRRLWVQPAAGDAGGALGAALLVAHGPMGVLRVPDVLDGQKGSFLGPDFEDNSIAEVIRAYDFVATRHDDQVMPMVVAEILAQGNVVGVFHGRMEFGPRALGARSIMGDPRDPEMQRRMNLKIKYRESFRPFAPMVRRENVADWFQVDGDHPYMLITTPVADAKRKVVDASNAKGLDLLRMERSDIPAVTHVDYSARVQTVDGQRNPFSYAVLSAFWQLTGCPVLINTSFNIRGEPIVCTPLDALRCFMNTEMDSLVLGNYVLFKSDQKDQLRRDDFADSFAPD